MVNVGVNTFTINADTFSAFLSLDHPTVIAKQFSERTPFLNQVL
jgi:hypothetical protein